MIKDGVQLSDTQIRTLQWMHSQEERIQSGAVGHTMGQGKTLMLLSLTDSKLERDSPKKDLYIVPPGLLKQWKEETEKLTTLKCGICERNDDDLLQKLYESEIDIIFYSYYSLLYADLDSYIFSVHWNRVVADEAHQIRNPEAKISKKTHELRATYRWAMSGTFLVNSPKDLYGICKFLHHPSGATETAFQQYMRRGNLIKEIMIQSNKDDLEKLGLPEKTELVEYCDMSPEEFAIYNSIKLSARRQALIATKSNKKPGTNLNLKKPVPKMLELINNLRLASCDLSLVATTELPPTQKVGSKVKSLLALVLKIRQTQPTEKILIFSNFISIISLYKKWLAQIGCRALIYTGEIPRNERDELIDAFKKDISNKYPVMILGYKCASAGINLQCATHVILSEPFWNGSVEEQAIARSYRKGQTKNVVVYRLITKRSIEERITKISMKKNKQIKRALGNPEDMTEFLDSMNGNNSLSSAEIKEILDI